VSDGEAPTPRRRAEARARGEVAVSPMLLGAGALVGAAVAGSASIRAAGGQLAAFARAAFGGDLAARGPSAAMNDALIVAAGLALPILLGAIGGALAAGLVQTRALFTLRALGRRDRSRIDATSGSTPLRAAVALAIVLLAVVAARSIGAAIARAPSVEAAASAVGRIALPLGARMLALVALVGVLELLLARRRLDRALTMSREERRRERREEGGDPRLRREVRARARQGATVEKPPSMR
jgi:flagellar biosynthetic protein FlhB